MHMLFRPECPTVSTALPKKRTYSVRDACSRHMDPIQPPAFMNTHCRSFSGRMCPGYFFRNSLCSSWKAFLISAAPERKRSYLQLIHVKAPLHKCMKLLLNCDEWGHWFGHFTTSHQIMNLTKTTLSFGHNIAYGEVTFREKERSIVDWKKRGAKKIHF